MKEGNNQTLEHSIEIIRYKIADDMHNDFESAYRKAGEHLKASPFCLGYHVMKGDDEPNNYIVTIYWTSKEDHLTKFRSSEEFSSFLPFVRPFFDDILEMKHYSATDNRWSRLEP